MSVDPVLVKVRLVVVLVFHPLEPVKVTAELVISSVLVLLLLLTNEAQESAKPPVEKVPAVKVTLAVVVNAPPNVQPPPTPLNITAGVKVLPLVVIVLPVVVDENVIVPDADQVIFATIVKLPAQLIVPVLEKVLTPDPVQSSDKQANAPVSVTVPVPEAALKNTLSEVVGTEAPEAPPEEADQLVVEEVFHVPAPPTQYLSAIKWLLQASLPLEQHQLGLNQQQYLRAKEEVEAL